MNSNFSSQQGPQPQDISVMNLVEQEPGTTNQQGFRFFRWWYRFAAPSEPSANATLAQRETFRRGRLIATMLLILIILDSLVILTVGIFVHPALIPNMLTFTVITLITSRLNKKGFVLASGILVVCAVEAGMIANIFTYTTGFDTFLLPFLDIFVLGELLAVSLLPPVAVFVVAAFNILFIISTLTFLVPQTPALQAILHSPSIADAIVRPTVLQIAVAVTTFLWAHAAAKASARANRATVIATLERQLSEQSQATAEQKRRLDESIQQIVEVHQRVANGDLNARVPLSENNVLWNAAGALNNLLARFQRANQDTLTLKRTNDAIELFIQARNQAGGGIIHWQPTGTITDILVQQHNATVRSTISSKNSVY